MDVCARGELVVIQKPVEVSKKDLLVMPLSNEDKEERKTLKSYMSMQRQKIGKKSVQ